MSVARSLKDDFKESDEELDSSVGDLSFDFATINSENVTFRSPRVQPEDVVDVVAKSGDFSPPYRTVRALRLFNSPYTPKSIIQKSIHNPGVTISTPGGSGRCENTLTIDNVANVNPFTPTGMLMASKKRPRCISTECSPDVRNNSHHTSQQLNLSASELGERLAGHKWTAKRSNISRYHHDFCEMELIGSGQFGSVFKCINRLDGCVYAIKKSKRPVAGSKIEKSALNEVYAHAVLGTHPHVVRYYSAWAEDHHMIIQNEYCDGGSLADHLLHSEPLRPTQLRRLLQHVAEGLRYIHSKGLVHLDIKPGNIFISRERGGGRVTMGQQQQHDSVDDGFEDGVAAAVGEEVTYKIGDLGHVTSVANPKVEEGDCRYLCTNILHENYTHLPKADIFSLGVSLLEAAGLTPLPKNGTYWHQLRAGGQLPRWLSPRAPLPTDLDDVIREMIQPAVGERPTAAQVLACRALQRGGCKSKAQLYKELGAERQRNEILSRQLLEAAKCIKSITPDVLQLKNVTRLNSKKFKRSFSTTTF